MNMHSQNDTKLMPLRVKSLFVYLGNWLFWLLFLLGLAFWMTLRAISPDILVNSCSQLGGLDFKFPDWRRNSLTFSFSPCGHDILHHIRCSGAACRGEGYNQQSVSGWGEDWGPAAIVSRCCRARPANPTHQLLYLALSHISVSLPTLKIFK